MIDTFITIIAIVLSTILLVVFPVMTMADKVDEISQSDIETITSQFINEIKTTGKLTPENYNKFLQEITSTGNTYDTSFEFKILDENPGKKSTQTVKDKIGENVYYSVFTTQVEEKINQNQPFLLKEGDIVSVTVRNTNLTLAQQFRDFLYTLIGDDTYTIATSQGGLVVKTALD